jgi:hypothetical protein
MATGLSCDADRSGTPIVVQYPAADAAWKEIVVEGANFWSAVRERFMDRELTKTDVRQIIRRGLEHTQGNYRKLIELFHLPAADYKRFLAFLYQHDCHLAFHPFRDAAPEESGSRAQGGVDGQVFPRTKDSASP